MSPEPLAPAGQVGHLQASSLVVAAADVMTLSGGEALRRPVDLPKTLKLLRSQSGFFTWLASACAQTHKCSFFIRRYGPLELLSSCMLLLHRPFPDVPYHHDAGSMLRRRPNARRTSASEGNELVSVTRRRWTD